MKWISMIAVTVLGLAACRSDKDDPAEPEPVNEEELITTLELHFHSTGGTQHRHISFTDLDGDGGDPPVILADTLSHDSVYAVEVELWNASVSPALDIAAEIAEEAEAHQFFFVVSGANAQIAYADADANGQPIGLTTTWTMGGAGAGTSTVILRHEPDKSGTGVSGGDITNAGGDTDLEVMLPLVIE